MDALTPPRVSHPWRSPCFTHTCLGNHSVSNHPMLLHLAFCFTLASRLMVRACTVEVEPQLISLRIASPDFAIP